MALAVMLALSLTAACRSSSSETVLRFWAMGREGEVVVDLVREFERAHSGIRVNVQQLPWTAAHEKLLTAFAGGTTFGSVKVMATVSLVEIMFQKLSTALTVPTNAVPATWGLVVPVFPATVPGVAVSPGASTCNWVNAAGLTTTLLDVAPTNPLVLNPMVMVSATL